jgi:hypothetical protein
MSIASRQRETVRNQQLGRSKPAPRKRVAIDKSLPDFNVTAMQQVAAEQVAMANKRDKAHRAGLRGAFAENGLPKHVKRRNAMLRVAKSQIATNHVEKELSKA